MGWKISFLLLFAFSFRDHLCGSASNMESADNNSTKSPEFRQRRSFSLNGLSPSHPLFWMHHPMLQGCQPYDFLNCEYYKEYSAFFQLTGHAGTNVGMFNTFYKNELQFLVFKDRCCLGMMNACGGDHRVCVYNQYTSTKDRSGVWTPWSSWSKCTGNCKQSRRTRDCYTSSKEYKCSGDRVEIKTNCPRGYKRKQKRKRRHTNDFDRQYKHKISSDLSSFNETSEANSFVVVPSYRQRRFAPFGPINLFGPFSQFYPPGLHTCNAPHLLECTRYHAFAAYFKTTGHPGVYTSSYPPLKKFYVGGHEVSVEDSHCCRGMMDYCGVEKKYLYLCDESLREFEEKGCMTYEAISVPFPWDNIDSSSPSPESCQLTCQRDTSCQRFNYAPSGSGTIAGCTLVNSVQVHLAPAEGIVTGPKYCGTWSEWSSWSICTGKCGQSTKTRGRMCFSSTEGYNCPGNRKETKRCEVDLCGRLLSNNDVANLCCFIIRSKTEDRTYILTDHELKTPGFNKTCGSCAYSPYDESTSTVDTSKQICLNKIGPDYVCCSQQTGALCDAYDPKSYTKKNIIQGKLTTDHWFELTALRGDVRQQCSPECKEIADCKPGSQNKWCTSTPFEDVLSTEDKPETTPAPVPKVCEPMVDITEEPVYQSAEVSPNALIPKKGRTKRSTWSRCQLFNAWVFTCYQAVHYMLYNQKKSWYYIEWKDKWRFFKHGCCSEFQAKCWDHPKLKKHKEHAICPSH